MAEDALIGATVSGRYVIKRCIAEGRTARIYEAVHNILDSRCIVKVLRAELASDPAKERRFFKEAQHLSRVRHPNVVRIFDFGTLTGKLGAGSFMIALERVPGRTVSELLQSGPLLPEQAVKIAVEVALCLHAAHQVNIAHRGLRPSEVMLVESGSEEGAVKVLDWGDAELLESAPELDAARAADQQAVGQLLQQMLIGAAGPGVVSSYGRLVPAWLSAVIERATAARPEGQFSSLEAMAQALQAGEVAGPPPARDVGPLRFCPCCGSQTIERGSGGLASTGACSHCGATFALLDKPSAPK